MAVLKNIVVHVQVKGNNLTEYDEPIDDTADDQVRRGQHRVAKYVEAEAGENFTIRVDVPKDAELGGQFFGLGYKLYIDGVCVDMPLHNVFPHTILANSAISCVDGVSTERALRFDSVNKSKSILINDDYICHLCRLCEDRGVDVQKGTESEYRLKFAKVGTVRLEVTRVLSITHSPVPKKMIGGAQLGERDIAVPTKALATKANWLRTSLGDPKHAKFAWFRSKNHEDDKKNPFMVFEFYYRSRDALKALLILPPDPDLATCDPSKIPDAEKDEAIRRLQARLEAAERSSLVKTEGSGQGSSVKLEGTAFVKVEGNAGALQGPKRKWEDDDELSIITAQQCKRRKPEADNGVVELLD